MMLTINLFEAVGILLGVLVYFGIILYTFTHAVNWDKKYITRRGLKWTKK